MSLPFTPEELESMNDDKELKVIEDENEIEEETAPAEEPAEEPVEELGEEPVEPLNTETEIFEIPKKPRKKRKPLTEIQKDKLRASLAIAREKSKQKRAALKVLRQKEEAQEKAIAKKHIKARKQKKMLEEAHLEVNAEQTIFKEEQDLWNEDKITSLMNRTLDTYFTKRAEQKKTREHFPMGPQGQPTYMPQQPAYHQTQPQRQIPKPAPPRKPTNPYFEMFGLTAEDEKNNNK